MDFTENEAYFINYEIGEYIRQKYDEYLKAGMDIYGYKLNILLGSLEYQLNPYPQENDYYLKAKNERWTKIAYFFEYGCMSERITPKIAKALLLVRGGKFSKAEFYRSSQKKYAWRRETSKNLNFRTSVKAFNPIFAMTKAKIAGELYAPFVIKDLINTYNELE